MTFLVIVAIALAAFVGYEFYKAKTAFTSKPTVLELVEEAKVELAAVEAKAEVVAAVVKDEVKKAAPKAKRAAKKVVEEVKEEVEEVKAKVTRKRKPNIKVAD